MFQAALQKYGIAISEAQASKITSVIDLNADGGVSMTELKTLAVWGLGCRV